MALKPFGEITYIEYPLYASLIDKNFTLAQLVNWNQRDKKLSPLTRAEYLEADQTIKRVLFREETPQLVFDPALTQQETVYLTSKIRDYLTSDFCYAEGEECYDVIPVAIPESSEMKFLVVVKQGFLRVVTETKEALLKHLLTLLRHLYDNNAYDWCVRREYLGQKLNAGYYDLTKLRFEKV